MSDSRRENDSDSDSDFESFMSEKQAKASLITMFTFIPSAIKMFKTMIDTAKAEKANLSPDKVAPFLTEILKQFTTAKLSEQIVSVKTQILMLKSTIDSLDADDIKSIIGDVDMNEFINWDKQLTAIQNDMFDLINESVTASIKAAAAAVNKPTETPASSAKATTDDRNRLFTQLSSQPEQSNGKEAASPTAPSLI
jgi:hypothetical protein